MDFFFFLEKFFFFFVHRFENGTRKKTIARDDCDDFVTYKRGLHPRMEEEINGTCRHNTKSIGDQKWPNKQQKKNFTSPFHG
jgi:hypothetical protein